MKKKDRHDKTKLTLKQEKSVEAYLRLQNGTQAYKEVYGKKLTDGYAAKAACLMVNKGKVQEAIEDRKKTLQRLNTVCTVEELAEGWSGDIRLDIGDLVDEHGTFLSPKDLPDNVRKLIQGVKIKESIVESEGGQNTVLNRWIEYELPNRQKARIELGKRLRWK